MCRTYGKVNSIHVVTTVCAKKPNPALPGIMYGRKIPLN